MAATTHNNYEKLPAGPVDWVAVFNDLCDKLEAGQTMKLTASVTLAQYDPFYVKSDGKAGKATNLTACVGLWQSTTTAADAIGYGQRSGIMAKGTWTWTKGGLIYIVANSSLTQTFTPGAHVVGLAISATGILLLPRIQPRNELEGVAQTTDATPATLLNFTLAEGKAYLVEARIVGKQGDTNRGAYIRRALVYRPTGGSATLQGSVQDALTVESEASWDCTIDVNGNDARIRVTGAAVTIDWMGKMNVV